jgi:hypothetical protein
MGCRGFGYKPPKLKPEPIVEDEFYLCDGCGFVGMAFDFELVDKDGQLCLECVLESF